MRRVTLGPGAILGFHQQAVVSAQLEKLAVRARLSGPLAAVEVVQTFTNRTGAAVEMAYLFPLPEQATLTRFCAVGARRWEGQVADSGCDLLQNRRPTFLNSYFEGEQEPVLCVGLGLVEPGQQVTVELAYADLMPDQRFHFPLLDRSGQLPAQFSLALLVEADEVRCNHPAQISRMANGDLRVDLQSSNLIQDFHLQATDRAQALVRQSARHFLLQLTPPQPDSPRLPRDLVVLVDCSENARHHFEAAKLVAHRLLTTLSEKEQFALVVFNHNVDGFQMGSFQPPQQACQALAWLEGQRPGGRADLSVLLDRVLSLQSQRALAVVLVACGKVGNEPEMYARVCAQPSPPRFFTVGLGKSVNPAFLRRLAGVTRGSAFVGESTDRLIEDTRQPWLSHFSVTDQGLAPVAASLVPATFPHLTQGGVSLMGMKNGQGSVRLRASTCTGQLWEETALSCACQNPALPLLWASQKVAEMLDELKLISGPRASQMRQISLDLCREYRLVTELTAFTVDGTVLPSLRPDQWPGDPAPVTTGLPSQRIQLQVPTTAAPVMTEPKKVRAGLISPQKDEPGPGGLRPKITRQKKYNSKRSPGKPAFTNMGAVLVRARKVKARQLLAEVRSELMSQLRSLYQTQDLLILEATLRRLQPLRGQSELLDEVYRMGLVCYRDLRAGSAEGKARTVRWVQRFASLF